MIKDFVLAHDEGKLGTRGCNNNDGTNLCRGNDNEWRNVCDK